jgi:trimethylguanosine synthase
MPPYPLSALAPVSGKEIFELTSRISPNIAFYLPKNTDTNELASLAPDIVDESGKVVGKEWVEIEEEYVGQRKGWNSLKAITAYYGGIVTSEE